jgi:hypothetical protein
VENLQRLEMSTSTGVGVGGGEHEAEERTAKYVPARCGVLASAGARGRGGESWEIDQNYGSGVERTEEGGCKETPTAPFSPPYLIFESTKAKNPLQPDSYQPPDG